MNQGATRARRTARLAAALAAAAAVIFCASAGLAEEVLIAGDARLKPVAEVISGIQQTLKASARVCAPGDLEDAVKRAGARTVIALGREPIEAALRLPPSVAVVYGLTILPSTSTRPNTTGTYMATPVVEYANLLRKYLPALKRISVVGSRDLLRVVGADRVPQVSLYRADTSFDLMRRVNELEGTDALLLLPDVNALTPTALEGIFLYSFRKKVPLLGLSEKHVKQGALLALVIDPVSIGRQIGEIADETLAGAGGIPPAPARKFDLFVNVAVARALGIAMPAELLKCAKRVYP